MDYNFITNIQTCADFVANSNPVTLILYTHIPSAVLALIIGILVLVKNKTLLGKILFGITIFFAFWTLIDLVAWLSTNSVLTMVAWSLFLVTTSIIAILSFYFFYVFLFGKDLGFTKKLLVFSPLLPIIFLTPTTLNLTSFDLVNCEAVENIIMNYFYYALGGLAIIGILLLLAFGWRKIERGFRKEVVLMVIGMELFLISFFSLGYIAGYLDNYSIEFYGLFGMVIFMAFLAFLIVKFKTFDVKLLGAQALVWALIILVGSEFLFVETQTAQILTGITLVISAIVGMMIVRSVKKEVALREELEVANENQQLLIRFITHQVKGFFTKSKMIFASFLDGDVGEISAPQKEMLSIGLESDNKAVEMVQEVLKASSLRTGEMTYTFEEVNVVDFIKEIAESFRGAAVEKSLQYEVNLPVEKVLAKVDKLQMTQVIKNLIDNSIKYTPNGMVKVSLVPKNGKIIFSVHDNGVGLSDSDKAKLFKEGGRGEESLKHNVNSTGYGLFIVKKIVEGHGGKIWAESAGRGHGSTFLVELPSL